MKKVKSQGSKLRHAQLSEVESEARFEERGARSEIGSPWRTRISHLAPRSSHLAPRSSRRGVLLLVVLSMLVLFMLIGTAFLMSSSQSRTAAKAAAKKDRLGSLATKKLDGALLQLLRDTENPYSVIKTQSLLRDLYGTDGFQTVVNKATYARQISVPPVDNTNLGSTVGQMIDLFVTPAQPIDDTTTPNVNEAITGIGLPHVIKLERNALGRPQLHALPSTKGYYNGCLLTVTSGPAAGKSTRILDYQFVGDDPVIQNLFPTAVELFPNPKVLNIWRLRVMAIGRADGQSFGIIAGSPPTISDLDGATFIVNGRAFNGTGVGYNPTAAAGEPRLNAFETVSAFASFYGEIALLPNSVYFFPCDPDSNPANTADVRGARFYNLATGTYDPLNPKITSNLTTAQAATLLAQWKYPSFVGAGDADEPYDAADFQNIFLALQTVTPRSQGRVVQGDPPVTLSAVDPGLDGTQFLRLDLEDLPLPSFHRPDLVNFWYHRLIPVLMAPPCNLPDEDAAVAAILDPYPNGQLRSGLTPDAAALITAVKRKIMMRPIREDHPNFNGSNELSVVSGLPTTDLFVPAGDPSGNIAIPFWEAVGPWDVDNDNDGIPDSVWIDGGDPVLEFEDGTRYKTLYSVLIIDLDSRLNVNAHGLVDHFNPPQFDANSEELAGELDTSTNPVSIVSRSADALPHGIGFGPAEISLRPVFPVPVNSSNNPIEGNRSETSDPDEPVDSYASILAGRWTLEGKAIPGRWGFDPDLTPTAMAQDAATPGLNYRYSPDNTVTVDQQWPDLASQLKFFCYPWTISDLSGFASPPDLFGRYSLGLNHAGQPFYEVLNDENPNTAQAPATYIDRSLLADSPYELDLSNSQRRDTWTSINSAGTNMSNMTEAFNRSLDFASTPAVDGLNDDAPYSPTDLERILRAGDADAGTLPSRLWDVANDFDPEKLIQFDQWRVRNVANAVFNGTFQLDDPQILATAQQIAAINRHLVTTDSVDLPVSGGNLMSRLIYGADGMPGKAGVNDDGDNGPNGPLVDEPDEYGWSGSDDYHFVMGGAMNPSTGGPINPPLLPPLGPTLVDLLRYRIQYERLTALPQMPRSPLSESDLNNIVQQLLAPELLAGKRMDLNRPFGDGHDNNGNGIVDEPLEAGEPFIDLNADGIWQDPEPYRDLDNDGRFYADTNDDGAVDNNDNKDFDGDLKFRPVVDTLWAGLWPVPDGDGTLGEKVAFDHVNGADVNLDGWYVDANGNGVKDPIETAIVHDDGQLARQLYARQLYCLMLLLMDENYIAPWDPNDPQVMTWIKAERKKIEDGLTALAYPVALVKAQADLMVKRKLTCRMVAQWAINCVDMQDTDAIMTGFEYDENPWDGWGTRDETGATPRLVFLDGEIGTNENLGVRSTVTQAAQFDRTAEDDVPPIDQTRNFVWGAERPDLLITETLAFHDRKAQDEATDNTLSASAGQGDEDLDQRLKPVGSLFVELYNPWIAGDWKPAEVYRYPLGHPGGQLHTYDDQNGDPQQVEGVLLHRKSDYTVQVAGNAAASPVWRMAVVGQSKPQLLTRYAGFENEIKDGLYGTWARKAVTELATTPEFRMLNIDDPTFDSDKDSERWVYFAAPSTTGIPLRIPAVPTQSGGPPVVGPGGVAQASSSTPTGKQYFLAKDAAAAGNNDPAEILSPIMPGRYAVVGSSGVQYKIPPTKQRVVGTNIPRFVTTIGRIRPTSSTIVSTDPQNLDHSSKIDETRRFELRPQKNPELQQMLTAMNGGPEFLYVINTQKMENLTDSSNPNAPMSGVNNIRPAVVIPVAEMNITEPVTGYVNENVPLTHPEYGKPYNSQTTERGVTRPNTTGEIEFQGVGAAGGNQGNQQGGMQFAFDVPLDTDLELVRNGTTANYKTIHLQRLANPLLPWNPLPTRIDGTANPEFNADLAVNPYLTIDSSSVDMTAFNGVELKERTGLPSTAGTTANASLTGASLEGPSATDDPEATTAASIPKNQWHMMTRYLPWEAVYQPAPGGTQQTNAFKQRFHLKSLERGAHARQGKEGGLVLERPARTVWAQEPPNRQRALPPSNNATASYDRRKRDQFPNVVTNPPPAPPTPNTIDRVDHNVDDDAARETGLYRVADPLIPGPTGGDLVNVLHKSQRTQQLRNVYQGFPQTELDKMFPPSEHIINYVMEQTLGFQNVAWGDFYNRAEDQASGVPDSARGVPKPYRYKDSSPAATQHDVNSTFPWLAWNNRPFVSADELLNVSSRSAAQMLRADLVDYGATPDTVRFGLNYSTINPTTPANSDRNPYDGSKTANLERLALLCAPFGHLTNVFATADFRAYVPSDPMNPGSPAVDANGDIGPSGAPHFYRILEYVQVPSRYVGTDVLLNAETFNDVPGVVDAPTNPTAYGSDIVGPNDPRYLFQPPFNRVSRERDPGRINLNTVLGRRNPPPTTTDPAVIWSEVFDGIMHRTLDKNPSANQLGHGGPAWRDVVLSRRGYAQYNAGNITVPVEKLSGMPDVFQFGLKSNFPTMFANPFRTPDAGDLVPLTQMMQFGVDATLLRKHPYDRAIDPSVNANVATRLKWGPSPNILNFGDARDAGFGANEAVSVRSADGRVPSDVWSSQTDPVRDTLPLFSELRTDAYGDTERNPYMMYQPMTRLGNLVTNRSNVFAIWITVGYFEVEPAPNWNHPDAPTRLLIRQHFGGTNTDTDPATIAALALYNRVYPDGYMLGKEVGSDTGDVKRPRGFYIVDRTEEVGFKPGEDINVDKMIRLRRRIE